MANATLTPARALRQPRRIDRRALVGIILTIVAAFGWIAFWTATADTRGIVLATRELPAGAILGRDDLAVSHVRVSDEVYAAAVPSADLEALVGRQLAEPVHPQQVLARAQVSARPILAENQLALTIAVSPETAVGGRVRPGDAVQVLVTTNKGKPESRTAVVLPRVTVYDVGYDQRQVVVGGSGNANQMITPGALRSLTLVVTQEEAIALAQAKWAGELDVALVPAGQQ